ncbi:MAG: hypothetical protein V2L15_09675, partial [Desulfobacteraceae bacterium]|nr:hypothetical protein [Desulfobacteraceae bacterium]
MIIFILDPVPIQQSAPLPKAIAATPPSEGSTEAPPQVPRFRFYGFKYCIAFIFCLTPRLCLPYAEFAFHGKPKAKKESTMSDPYVEAWEKSIKDPNGFWGKEAEAIH